MAAPLSFGGGDELVLPPELFEITGSKRAELVEIFGDEWVSSMFGAAVPEGGARAETQNACSCDDAAEQAQAERCRAAALEALRATFARILGRRPSRKGPEHSVDSRMVRMLEYLLRACADDFRSAGLYVSAAGPSHFTLSDELAEFIVRGCIDGVFKFRSSQAYTHAIRLFIRDNALEPFALWASLL